MREIRLGLVASGSGTDADAIMKAYRQGKITNAVPVVLVSTKRGAGCIAKAKENKVDAKLAERKGMTVKDFRDQLLIIVKGYYVQMLFLVGCVVVFPPFIDQPIYNIHPSGRSEEAWRPQDVRFGRA